MSCQKSLWRVSSIPKNNWHRPGWSRGLGTRIAPIHPETPTHPKPVALNTISLEDLQPSHRGAGRRAVAAAQIQPERPWLASSLCNKRYDTSLPMSVFLARSHVSTYCIAQLCASLPAGPRRIRGASSKASFGPAWCRQLA
jgi:hypothetical protein